MDAISAPACENVVVMSSAQVGKSEILLNVLGYYIEYDPAPILMMQPTVGLAEDFSKDRVAPMLRDTPALAERVADPRSRDTGNTILHKTFPGGHLTLTGANAPSGLASRPIRIVLADEIDRYPPSAGQEGDPLNLARKRTATFWNRKVLSFSTPTVKGKSRIEAAFNASDKRRFYVPCAECGHSQILRWGQVEWPKGDPSSAAYVCEACGSLWSDAARWKAIAQGKWEATAPFHGTAGFHLNALYSSWTRLGEIAAEFEEARRLPETLRVFVNTALGESWEEAGETIAGEGLIERLENYSADDLPAGVLMITAGVDVQDDRFEIEIVGHGEAEETWSLGYRVLYGDPSRPDLWDNLKEELSQRYDHPSGRTLPIAAAAIDSGGHFTQEVYQFCKRHLRRRWWAIKGQGGEGRPVVGKPSRSNSYRVPLFPVGSDTGKKLVYSRLAIEEPGPGFCHFPAEPEYDQTYFDGLTAEQLVTKWYRGRPRRYWELKSGRVRNEPLDCRVYALAAFYALHPRLDKIGKRMAKAAEERDQADGHIAEQDAKEAQDPPPAPKRPRRAPQRKRWSLT